MPLLRVMTGHESGHCWELGTDEFVIGRHPRSGLVLRDAMISRKHARVVRRNGAYYVEDLRSRNGTSVNGQAIEAPVRLRHGDRIDVHGVTLSFEEHATPVPVGPDTETIESFGGPAGGSDEVPWEMFKTVDLSEVVDNLRLLNTEMTLEAVMEITRSLGGPPELDQLLPRILDSLFRIFPQTERGYILRTDETTGELALAAIRDRAAADEIATTMRPLARALARKVMQKGHAVRKSDDALPDAPGTDSVIEIGLGSMMCAPLMGPSGQARGIIYLDSEDPLNRFSQDDLDVLACVAILAGQAVEHASQYERRFRAMVEAALDAIVTIDHQGRIIEFNAAAESVFGYSRYEALGREMVELIVPRPLRDSARAAQGGWSADRDGARLRRRLELTAVRRNGQEFPIELSVFRIPVDGPPMFTGFLRDITERRRAENELKRWNETLEQRVEERTMYVQLHQDVATIANEAESLEQAMGAALVRICRSTRWPAGHAWIRIEGGRFAGADLWAGSPGVDVGALRSAIVGVELAAGEGLVGRAAAARRPLWLADLSGDPSFARSELLATLGAATAVAFPVVSGNEAVAVLQFFSTQAAEPDPELMKVLGSLGTQLGRVAERRRLQSELIDAMWQQQRYFGQELHDSLGQELTGLRMMADSLRHRLESQLHAETAAAAELTGLIGHALQSARRMAKGLFPVEIDSQGLMAALDELTRVTAAQSGIACEFHCRRPVQVHHSNEVATHLFRIAQEATTNAVRHSRPTRIIVALEEAPAEIILKVLDNGAGFREPESSAFSGMGLRIMRYRASIVGARLSIGAGPAGGTLVACRLPQRPAHRIASDGK